MMILEIVGETDWQDTNLVMDHRTGHQIWRTKTFWLFAIATLLCTLSAIAQTNSDTKHSMALTNFLGQPYHPFRKVGDKYCDLRPIYNWMRTTSKPIGQLTTADRTTPRPMKDWIGEPHMVLETFRATVIQSVASGLLVKIEFGSLFPIDSPLSSKTIFLINYPFADQVIDGQSIKFLAIRTGIHRFEDALGSISSIALYDYGVPYDPKTVKRP